MCFKTELVEQIHRAIRAGASVHVTIDPEVGDIHMERIQSVRICGLNGCIPHPLPPISAIERIRLLLP